MSNGAVVELTPMYGRVTHKVENHWGVVHEEGQKFCGVGNFRECSSISSATQDSRMALSEV